MKGRVLVVDDMSFMRMILKQLLEDDGFKVIAEARTGVEAVRLYKSYRPDIVTMNITMPEMDGLEALTEIMRFDAHAKVIMISAMGQKHMVIEAVERGAKDFIVKPFKSEKVLESLNKWIDGKEE